MWQGIQEGCLKTVLIQKPLVIATLRALEDDDKALVHKMSPLGIYFRNIKAEKHKRIETLPISLFHNPMIYN